MKTEVKIKNNIILAEIADTPIKKARGLMFRFNLKKNSGMIFIFEKPNKPKFWMVNTFIPLDMIWIDENKKIVDFTKNAQPMSFGNLGYIYGITYSPRFNVKYVLEVNAGYINNKNIKIGDFVEIKDY